jgi:hypothetical protein
MIKPLLSILLIGILCATGCTERIPRSHLKARAFDLNLMAAQGRVTVDRIGGRPETVVEHFSILGDSVIWIEPETDASVSIPTTTLNSFTINDRLNGARYGSTIGIVAGGIFGSMVDLQSSTLSDTTFGVAIGAVVGTTLGLLIGIDTDYIIEP